MESFNGDVENAYFIDTREFTISDTSCLIRGRASTCDRCPVNMFISPWLVLAFKSFSTRGGSMDPRGVPFLTTDCTKCLVEKNPQNFCCCHF